MHSDVEISLLRQLRALRVCSITATIVAAVALLGTAAMWRNTSFDVLTVHRLNVVDQTGAVRLAFFNAANEPAPVIAGRVLSKVSRAGGTRAGMFFYNEIGEEQGGLTYNGDQRNGNSALLSFDPFRQNDDVDLYFFQNRGGNAEEGLTLSQHAVLPLTTYLDRMKAAQSLPAGPVRSAKIQALRREGFLGNDRFFAGVDGKQRSAIVLDDAQGHPHSFFR
jgi:hypothetical protein